MRAEFTVEPFVEGNPGPHVQAAIAAARASTATVEVGPFGTSLEGEPGAVLDTVGTIVRAAIEAGASRVTLQVSSD